MFSLNVTKKYVFQWPAGNRPPRVCTLNGGHRPCNCRHLTSGIYGFIMCLATWPSRSLKHSTLLFKIFEFIMSLATLSSRSDWHSTLFEVGVHDPCSIRHFLKSEFTILETFITFHCWSMSISMSMSMSISLSMSVSISMSIEYEYAYVME